MFLERPAHIRPGNESSLVFEIHYLGTQLEPHETTELQSPHLSVYYVLRAYHRSSAR